MFEPPKYKYILSYISFLLFMLAATICDALEVKPQFNNFTISYVADQNSELNIHDILSSSSAFFTATDSHDLSFGWVKHPYWFEVDVSNIQSQEDLILKMAMPLLDDVKLYIVDQSRHVLHFYHVGDTKVFSQRPFFDASFAFPVHFSEHSIDKIYIRVETTSSMHVPIALFSFKEYVKDHAIYLTVQGTFYGLLVVMILYNLLLYFSTRRQAYLFYVLFVSAFTGLQVGLRGVGFQFIWPNMPELNNYIVMFSGAFSLLFLTFFARAFLQLEKLSLMMKINNAMVVIAVIFIVLSFLFSYADLVVSFAVTVILFTLVVLVKGVVRYQQGFKEARFYLLAWLAISLGCILFLLAKLGVLPANAFTVNALQVGSACEVVLLSLALADRLKTLRAKLEQANSELEYQVKERTEQLEDALLELELANDRLEKQTITDSLTGLYNRHFFDDRLKSEIAKAHRFDTGLALILIDIDHFKKINDT